MFVQRVVEVGDVGLVMLTVVDLHRLRVDVRLEGREIVRQRRKYVSRLGRSRALFFYLCPRYDPEKFGLQTPHCAARFHPYLGSADVLSAPTSGGARGGVSAALAALSGRHYVDRPAVLFQFCTRAVHGGGGSCGQEYRDAKARASCPALVSRRRHPDLSHRSRDHWKTHRRVAARRRVARRTRPRRRRRGGRSSRRARTSSFQFPCCSSWARRRTTPSRAAAITPRTGRACSWWRRSSKSIR